MLHYEEFSDIECFFAHLILGVACMLKDWNVFISEVNGSEIKWNAPQSGRSKDYKHKYYVVDTVPQVTLMAFLSTQ